MNLDEFKEKKISAREQVKSRAIEVLKKINPVSIHQFGSGASKFRDEFSDLDFFVTLTDSEFDRLVPKREKIYSKTASILIRLYGEKPNLVGWYHDLIIHETEKGLFHVDYYLTPKSKVILPPNAIKISGLDFPPGTWDTWTKEFSELGSKPPKRRLDSILAMSYIGVKGVIRKWGPEFFDYIRSLYEEYQKLIDKKLESLPKTNDFKFIYSTLDNLFLESDEKQKKAIQKIKEYAKQIESLYMVNLANVN